MHTFYLVIDIITVILLFFLLLGLILNIIKSQNKLKRIGRTIGGIAILFLIWFVPQYYVDHYTSPTILHSFKEEIDFAEEHDFYHTEMSLYSDTLSKDSLNYELHFKYVHSFKKYMDESSSLINYNIEHFIKEDRFRKLDNTYKYYKSSKDTLKRDIGLLFNSLKNIYLGKAYNFIQSDLDWISDKSIPYYNYVQGLAYFHAKNWDYLDSSEVYLNKSIENNIAVKQSYRTLSTLYWYFSQDEKLMTMIKSPELNQYIPHWVIRDTHFNNWNIIPYWDTIFKHELNSYNVYGVVAAFLILILWIFLIVKMDIYEPERWYHLAITFILGLISMQFIYPIHDLLWNYLNIGRSSYPIADFGYMVVGIGMVEELVKILPVLIMLRFTNAINEPFDYILYPAISALAFSFIENLDYFNMGGLGNIDVRGIYCCIAHMSFSAIIGYSMMLAKYRKKYNKWLLFFIGFIVASFVHGFYDFWLLNWWGIDYPWISDLTIIILVTLFAQFINSTLNISNFFDEKTEINNDRLKFLYICSLLIILVIGFVIISIEFGPYSGYHYHYSHFRSLMFLIIFIALTMSSMKIIRRYFKPVKFPLFFLFPKKQFKQNLVGKQLKLIPTNKFSFEENFEGLKTEFAQKVLLKEQLKIENNPNCYLAVLEQPIIFNEQAYYRIIIQPEWEHKTLSETRRVLVSIYLVPNEKQLNAPLVTISEFQFIGRLFSVYLPEV